MGRRDKKYKSTAKVNFNDYICLNALISQLMFLLSVNDYETALFKWEKYNDSVMRQAHVETAGVKMTSMLKPGRV